MGLFDMFLSEEKKIRKNQRRVTNRDLQAEDREIAAHWLSDNGSPKALLSLMTRFEMKLEHQMNDRDEREFVYDLLVRHGDAIERPLRRHMKKALRIAMPLKLWMQVKGEEAAIELVYEMLQDELDRDDFKPQKKIDLLVWLTDRPHSKAIEQVTPFLKDFDEGVRYAAAEVILAQNDDSGRPLLEAPLVDPQEESNRLKVRLCEAFISRRWTLEQPDQVLPNLPDSHTITDGRIVAKA